MIELQNISKTYAGNEVLKDISLRIGDGEIFGLVGKNGAGKTTLLNIMAGITLPSGGTCRIDAYEIKRGALEQGYIGYLPDLPNFYEYLTGKEYLEFLASASKSDLQKDIDNLVVQMNLDTSKKIKNLSRGNRQKLGILAAVLGRPKILLLDEPTSALDPIGRKDTMAMIKKLKNSGISIILSTHILSDLELVCDRIGFLHNGVIAREVNLTKTDGTNQFYEITVGSDDVETTYNALTELLNPWPVICENGKIIVYETSVGGTLKWNMLFGSLANIPADIKKIEKKGRHDLEQIMEEVLQS